MGKFVIEPHFRLQEWVAEEKGYFRDEGLDHEFSEFDPRERRGASRQRAKVGAFQTIEKGREANVTCACHWTVNVAASQGPRQALCRRVFGRSGGIFVPADSPMPTPADLAGVPISVGFQSGSHYATIQALEQYLPPEQIKLSFGEGMLFGRMEAFLEGKAPAARSSAAPTTSPNSWASARSSTPPS